MMLTDLMNLSGKSTVITGAAGNIGKVFAATLAEMGSDLCLVDKDYEELCAFKRDLVSRFGVSVSLYACDLEIESERNKLLNSLLLDVNSLHCLVNNAAFVGTTDLEGWMSSFHEQSLSAWRRAFEVNLTSIFHLCQGLSPLLTKNHGNIVNVTSIYGKYGPDLSLYDGLEMGNPAAYASSKGGLEQLTRWLATVLAPEVRVNAISPGGVFREQPKEFVSRYIAKTPLKRMASEEDFKGAIAFLVSEMSSYVTGQTIEIDGGWGVW